MELQVLQENLSKAISVASRFASVKAQLPVLANILLKTKGNKLLINATNLEVSVSISIGAQVKTEGEISIPAKLISEIIANLGNKPIDIKVDKEQLNISTENFTSTISAMNTSDFPKIPTAIPKDSIELPSAELVDALSKVLFSVSIDESRPVITGVMFIFKPGSLTLVATDGFRLSQKKIKVEGLTRDENVIIPRAVLGELIRLAGTINKLSFYFNKEENQVVFGFPGLTLTSRIIDGVYPPFEKIIPKEDGFVLNVDKDEFTRSIKLASAFAKDSMNVIKLGIKTTGIDITAESKTAGNQKSFVEASSKGDKPSDSVIAFDYRFLNDIVGVIEGESINISFGGANAPGVFKDPNDTAYLHLIMPVKIQD